MPYASNWPGTQEVVKTPAFIVHVPASAFLGTCLSDRFVIAAGGQCEIRFAS
jgi:hypothetical protein